MSTPTLYARLPTSTGLLIISARLLSALQGAPACCSPASTAYHTHAVTLNYTDGLNKCLFVLTAFGNDSVSALQVGRGHPT